MTTSSSVDRPASLLDRPLWSALHWTTEKSLYLVLILAAFVTRFYDLGSRVMSHDESLHTQFGWYLSQGRGFQHSPMMHGPLRFELTALSYWLFGDSDFTARIVPALMGVAAVWLMYFFRKWLGRAGALVAALLMLISPYMLYYSRYIRDEPFVIVWGMLTALCVANYMETRAPKYLYGLAAVTALFYATMETSFIYVAISMLFLGLHLVRELFAVSWPRPEFRRPFEIAFAVTLAALLLAGGLLALGRQTGPLSGAETAQPANPEAGLTTQAAANPYQSAAVAAGGVAAVALAVGTLLVFRAFGNEMRRFPALDLLMVFGLFVLPQLTAFPVLALGRNPIDYNLPPLQGLPLSQALGTFFSSSPGVTSGVAVLLVALSVVLGWIWSPRLFVICAGIFYGIYIPLYTTFFTNGGGIATGLIGSLGYWLEQHGVQRGNQPWYYYGLIQVPLYEFLPALGALFGLGLGLRRWLRGQGQPAEPISPADTLGFPVIGYFGFWSVLALVGFSVAGEKMPWLTTHITLPLIWISGWAIGAYIDGTDWGLMRTRRGWLVVAMLPVAALALAALLGFGPGGLLGSQPPFRGSSLDQLQATGAFVSAAIVLGILGAALYRVGRDLGWANVGRLALLSLFGLLGLLTARAAFTAAYINYDSANEFLVYAHGARGVKTVMEQIDEIAERLPQTPGLKVAYDSDVAWPMTWYLRNYDKANYGFYGENPSREALNTPVVIAGPKNWSKADALLGNRYYRFEYLRMVWPMQEYFNLNAERIRSALTSADYRQALWDIWYNRDYKRYGELTNTSYALSEWPVAERLYFYVRKDIAAQIWAYGVGPTALGGEAVEADPYAKSRQTLTALGVWGGVAGAQSGSFDGPRGLAVGPDGSIYVADTRNHRIQKFDSEGQLLLSWGSYGSLEANSAGPGTFNEPWGVAVGPDGSVYVADTWNHRIQQFDDQGNFVRAWGYYGQGETPEALWGPRAVAVDPQGHVFVADTGNKRVVEFDASGTPLTTIGLGGFETGALDEPVGLAVDIVGNLYVADTWNQRVQVFVPDSTTGEYLFARAWDIAGWYGQSLENKPYLALDSRGRVYVTDPEGYRVLVFDALGNFITTWGDYGADSTTFGLAAGVAVDAAGNVYVTDSGNNRLMKFAPLP